MGNQKTGLRKIDAGAIEVMPGLTSATKRAPKTTFRKLATKLNKASGAAQPESVPERRGRVHGPGGGLLCLGKLASPGHKASTPATRGNNTGGGRTARGVHLYCAGVQHCANRCPACPDPLLAGSREAAPHDNPPRMNGLCSKQRRKQGRPEALFGDSQSKI